MSYQGWKNYESWAVALWLDNEQSLQRQAQRIVNRETNIYRAVDALKTFVTEDILPDLGASLAQELLNAAISEVDWEEVAKHFQDEAEESGDTYSVRTEEGTREWTADDAAHAREQHTDAFPEEPILDVQFVRSGPHA